MASALTSRGPQCTSCIRRMTSLGNAIFSPGGHQLRGKKKLAKVSTVNVQLLQNVPGYGRKGKILPISPGVMRNIWYPKKMAGYVTITNLQALGNKDITTERDPTFGSRKQREAARKLRAPPTTRSTPSASVRARVKKAAQVEPELYDPESFKLESIGPEILNSNQVTEILDRLLPPSLDFYRTTMPLPPKRVSPSIPAGSALSKAAETAAAQRIAKRNQESLALLEKTSIIGSVSTGDIAANLKAILAEDAEGRRVVVSPEHISFVDEVEQPERVKHLGSFRIEIKLDPASEIISRKINVKAQE